MSARPEVPYPGLRPFREDESELFFGRTRQVNELLARLSRHRFLAVVGPSGCGKSSLVTAGLLSALHEGLPSGDIRDWKRVVTHPGADPVRHLAQSLLGSGLVNPSWLEHGRHAVAFLTTELRSRPGALSDLVRGADLPDGTGVLLVVDQFEEIFRYGRGDPGDPEASEVEREARRRRRDGDRSFVELVLRVAHEEDLPVYVVLTMRSDYLGNCAVFPGMPEALNDSQFLTPRLTRSQCRAAIVGPARRGGATVDPLLVNEILNDVGPKTDDLPLMQHALMRIWRLAAEDPRWEEDPRLDLRQYREIGSLDSALSNHANEAFEELDSKQRFIAEVLFRCLTEQGDMERDTRRATSLRSVAKVADVGPGEVAEVVEVFRAPGRNFVLPPPGTDLDPDVELDISHESLIRQWGLLQGWIRDEQHQVRILRRIDDAAYRFGEDRVGPLGPIELGEALHFVGREQSTVHWALRYGCDLPRIRKYVSESERILDEKLRAEWEQDRREAALENRARSARRLALITLVFLVIAGALSVWAFMEKHEAETQRGLAVAAQAEAVSQKAEAEAAKFTAENDAVDLRRANVRLQAERDQEEVREILDMAKQAKDRREGILLTSEAVKLAEGLTGTPRRDAHQALREALGNELSTRRGLRDVAVAPDGSVVGLDADGLWLIGPDRDSKVPFTPPGSGKGSDAIRFAGQTVVVAAGRSLVTAPYPALSPFRAHPTFDGNGGPLRLRTTPDLVAVGRGRDGSNELALFRVGGGGALTPLSVPVESTGLGGFALSGRRLALAAQDGAVNVFDLDETGFDPVGGSMQAGPGLQNLSLGGEDGRWLSTVAGGRCRLFRLDAGAPDPVELEPLAQASWISPGGGWLLVSRAAAPPLLYRPTSVTDGTARVLEGVGSSVKQVAFDAKDEHLAMVGANNEVVILGLTGERASTVVLKYGEPVRRIEFGVEGGGLLIDVRNRPIRTVPLIPDASLLARAEEEAKWNFTPEEWTSLFGQVRPYHKTFESLPVTQPDPPAEAPVVTLGCFGPARIKAAVAAAISTVLGIPEGQRKDPRELMTSRAVIEFGKAGEAGVLERKYRLFHFPQSQDAAIDLVQRSRSFDGAIVVIPSQKGPTDETLADLALLSTAGIEHVVVVIEGHVEKPGKAAAVLDNEIRHLLGTFGFDPRTPIVKGSVIDGLDELSAAERWGRTLLEALEPVPVPAPLADEPFLMTVQATDRAGRLVGIVERGLLGPDDEVQLFGEEGGRIARVQAIDGLPPGGSVAGPAASVAIALSGDESSGFGVLAAPDSLETNSRFEALLHVVADKTAEPIASGHRCALAMWGTHLPGQIVLEAGRREASPGEWVRVQVNCGDLLLPLELHRRFALRDGRRVIGLGMVVGIGGEPWAVAETVIPVLVGKTTQQAVRDLGSIGLHVNVEQVVSRTENAGTVLSHVPIAGGRVEPGSTVTIRVAIEVGTVEVPDLSGRTEKEAIGFLHKAGLRAGKVVRQGGTARRVVSQNPGAGRRVLLRTQVDLRLAELTKEQAPLLREPDEYDKFGRKMLPR